MQFILNFYVTRLMVVPHGNSAEPEYNGGVLYSLFSHGNSAEPEYNSGVLYSLFSHGNSPEPEYNGGVLYSLANLCLSVTLPICWFRANYHGECTRVGANRCPFYMKPFDL